MLRRFLVLMAVMFWQGGFTFYGGVVVEVGARVLGSSFDQGLITRLVTNYLNAVGAAALILWAWDIAAADDRRFRQRLRWGLWLLMVVALGLLTWLHPRMDQLIDLDSPRILDHTLFRRLHRWYLITSTIQWLASLGLIAATLFAWREQDAKKAFTPRSL